MKCNICQSSKIKKLFYSTNTHGRHSVDSKEKFLISQCENCDAVFPSSVTIDKKYYEKYYCQGYYDEAGIKKNSFLGSFLTFISRLSNLRKERLILSMIDSKQKVSILDIGCGNGSFLASLNAQKFDKYGVEVNKEGYEISKKKGLNVAFGDIKEVNFGKKQFDAISLWHVLEHIDNPNELFTIIDKLLLKKGVLIFQIPNTDSYGFMFGKKDWFHLDTPRHLMLYGEKSVKKLCQLNNFEIVSIKNEFYEYPLDLFWSVRKSKIRFLLYPLYPFFKFFDRETVTYICRKKVARYLNESDLT